jgi:hypothetical protein
MSLLLVMATVAFASPPERSDPFVPQATLTASDEVGKSLLGSAAALSHDGNTALIGGPQDNNGVGAVWVFTRRGATWTERAKLTGGGEIGSGKFGTSVALSANGKTGLIGAPGDNGGLGAAWVVTRSGSTWTQQRGSKLTGGGEQAGGGEETYCEPGVEVCFVGQVRFGESVALSANGKTALIGGPGDHANDGAAWGFTRSGSTWTQQGEKLSGGGEQNFNERYPFTSQIGGQFGASVALAANGSTALIGGPRDRSAIYEGPELRTNGAAWVFTRFGSTWTQQGEKLSEVNCGCIGSIGIRFGESVALSSNGKTALIGAPNAQARGLAWEFTRSASTWSQQGEALMNRQPLKPPEVGGFALRLSLSSDGNAALISTERRQFLEAPAAAWAFSRAGSILTQQFPALTCGGAGCGVALSGDNSTALVGTAVYVDSTQDVEEEAHK